MATVRSHERLAGVRDLTSYLFTAIHRAAGRCGDAAGESDSHFAHGRRRSRRPARTDRHGRPRLASPATGRSRVARRTARSRHLEDRRRADLRSNCPNRRREHQYGSQPIPIRFEKVEILSGRRANIAGSEVVMDNSQFPSELERVEHALACAPRPEPSAALRRRVLDDVREELRHCVLHRLRVELLRQQKRSNRRIAVACAASFLVAVGLSIGGMHAAGVALKPPASAPTVADVAWRTSAAFAADVRKRFAPSSDAKTGRPASGLRRPSEKRLHRSKTP